MPYNANEFNPLKWLTDFRIASKNKVDFRELRAEIFQQTLKVVKSAEYTLNGKQIRIDNDAARSNTTFHYYAEQIETLQANYPTQIQVVEADCIEVTNLLNVAGYKACMLNMANRQTPGGGVHWGAGAQEENIFRRSNLFFSLYPFSNFAGEYGLNPDEHN